MADIDNPSSAPIGTKIAAIMGKVAKDEPIPIVTTSPTKSIPMTINALLSPSTSVILLTKGRTSPVSVITLAKTFAASMTIPIYVMILLPITTSTSRSDHLYLKAMKNIIIPPRAPKTIESVKNCTVKVTTIATSAVMIVDLLTLTVEVAKSLSLFKYFLGFLK